MEEKQITNTTETERILIELAHNGLPELKEPSFLDSLQILEKLNLHAYIELLPIVILGLMAGFIAQFSKKTNEDTWKVIIKHTLYATFTALIVFMCLSAVDLPYLAKVGASCLAAFFGIDEAVVKVANIINNLRGNKNG